MVIAQKRSKFVGMKKNRTHITLTLLVALLCSCGEDRTGEYNALTEENQWIHATMKEKYLWAGEMNETKQSDFFSTPEVFFKKLLNSQDDASFFKSATEENGYGFLYTLLRDPLRISPSRQYALVEYVEPGSTAQMMGLERGMWISEIDNNRVTTSNMSKLDGCEDGVELKVETIEFNDADETYYWEHLKDVLLPAAAPVTHTSIPVVTIIDDITRKSGYILCNSFDGEEGVNAMHTALSDLLSGGVNNIILDLRYNNSLSLDDAAQVASAFLPSSAEGSPFCYLTRSTAAEEGEVVPLPSSIINASDKPLYIITTKQTRGIANSFIKAMLAHRGDVKIVGQQAGGTMYDTESIESPYSFSINPATAYIYDAAGEALSPVAPHFVVDAYNNAHHPVYPLGDKQEHIIYNISYIMTNGTLPPLD